MPSLAQTNSGRLLTQNLLSRSQNSHSLTHRHQTRSVSTSPYGRTHVWKRRLPTLPNPIVPKFPQKVLRSDGSSFIQWTTSPRSLIRLTRDTTNNPVWNSGMVGAGGLEEESGGAGRLGRFGRKFGVANVGTSADGKEGGEEMTMAMGEALDDVKWFEEMAEMTGTEEGKGRKSKKDTKDKK